jgi:hypothetical protein
MPVPVIPICAISCCIPQPICEVIPPPPIFEYITPPPPTPCNPPQAAIDAAPIERAFNPLKIGNYCPTLPAPPSGTILTNTSGSVPEGYLQCNGLEVSRTTYNALYLAIGTYYGDGNGSTTFNLPNLSPEDASCVVMYIIKT